MKKIKCASCWSFAHTDCGAIPTAAWLFALYKLISVLSQCGYDHTSISAAAKDAKIQIKNFVKCSL